jgi:hypothetical protein
MRKLLLASGFAFAAIVRAGVAQAQLAGCTSFSCLQANLTNPVTTTTTTTNTTTNTNTLASRINADLQGSLLNTGALNETTANSWTSATGGAGSSFNTANVSGNIITEPPTKISVGSAVTMSYSVSGQGILQASQNTGANAVQQNSVAVTSTGNGGVLSGFSPTMAPVR